MTVNAGYMLVEVGRRTAWVRGGKARKLLFAALIDTCMWDSKQQAWAIPVNRVDDLLAVAEHRTRWLVDVKAVDR